MRSRGGGCCILIYTLRQDGVPRNVPHRQGASLSQAADATPRYIPLLNYLVLCINFSRVACRRYSHCELNTITLHAMSHRVPRIELTSINKRPQPFWLAHESTIINVFVPRVGDDAGATVVWVTPIKFTSLYIQSYLQRTWWRLQLKT